MHDLNQMYLTFDDLALLPARNRGTPNQVSLNSRVSRHCSLQVPILSAAMPGVTEVAMAIALAEFGGLGVLHRYMELPEQVRMVQAVRAHAIDRAVYPQASLGPDGHTLAAASVDPQDVERAVALDAAGAQLLFLDTPNASNEENLQGVEKIRGAVDADLVVGGIVDAATALDYVRLGVDALKVGLGAGALCSIRVTAGVGAPQATALVACCEIAAVYDLPVISDGGIKCSGDIVKALALGAGSVMLGTLLAGCDESPGPVVRREGALWKEVAGLKLDQIEVAAPTGYPKVDAYLQAHGVKRIEGGEGWVPATGPCHWTLLRLLRGVRAGVHMAGAASVSELKDKAQLVRVSPAGVAEGQVRVA